MQLVNKYFPFKEVENVVWLNEARHEGWEVQMVNLRGGSEGDGDGEGGKEGGLMWHYSCAAILVEVPGLEERRRMLEGIGEEEME